MNNQIDLVLPNLYAEFLSKIDKAGRIQASPYIRG